MAASAPRCCKNRGSRRNRRSRRQRAYTRGRRPGKIENSFSATLHVWICRDVARIRYTYHEVVGRRHRRWKANLRRAIYSRSDVVIARDLQKSSRRAGKHSEQRVVRTARGGSPSLFQRTTPYKPTTQFCRELATFLNRLELDQWFRSLRHNYPRRWKMSRSPPQSHFQNYRSREVRNFSP